MVERIVRREFLELTRDYAKGLATAGVVGAVATTASGLVVPASALAHHSKKKKKKAKLRRRVRRTVTPEHLPRSFSSRDMVSLTPKYRKRLDAATLEVLKKRFRRNQWWKKRGIDDKGLYERVHHSLGWVMHGIRESLAEKGDHYLPPPDLVAALFIKESGFNEYALSRVGALGVTQFMPHTGKAFELRCAGKDCRTGKYAKQVKLPGYAGAFDDYLRHLRKSRKAARGESADYKDLMKLLDQEVESGRTKSRAKAAMKNYRAFVRANIKGKDIFDRKDMRFLNWFDQRVGYRQAMPAAVRFLDDCFGTCEGNVDKGLAAYNSGIYRVKGKSGQCKLSKQVRASLDYAEDIIRMRDQIAKIMNA